MKPNPRLPDGLRDPGYIYIRGPQPGDKWRKFARWLEVGANIFAKLFLYAWLWIALVSAWALLLYFVDALGLSESAWSDLLSVVMFWPFVLTLLLGVLSGFCTWMGMRRDAQGIK